MALGHSFASASAHPSGIPSLPPRAEVSLLQFGAPTLGLRK